MEGDIITTEADRTAEAAEQIANDLSEYLPQLIGMISDIQDIQQFVYIVLLWFCGLLGLCCGLLLVLIFKKG